MRLIDYIKDKKIDNNMLWKDSYESQVSFIDSEINALLNYNGDLDKCYENVLWWVYIIVKV
jgi:hypothetical protein